jgi:DNA-binding MarR family transcriptional regulator
MPARRAAAPVEPGGLDLGHLGLFVGYAMADAVQAALEAGGHRGVRFSHGFVIQHLVDGPRPIGDLARRMGVTQQAASKVVAELEGLGYLARKPDGDDGRVTRVTLSARGKALVAASRRIRERLVERLDARCGARAIAAARRVLAAALDELGGADAVRARRVRAPR